MLYVCLHTPHKDSNTNTNTHTLTHTLLSRFVPDNTSIIGGHTTAACPTVQRGCAVVEVEDTSETPEQVQLRQATYLRSLAGANGNVLAVAHGAYIKHFLRNFAAVDTTEVKVGAQNRPALAYQ